MKKTSLSLWIAWIVASIFYSYQYILRILPSVTLPDIMNQFHMNAATFGQLSGIYYIGYSLMHLPVGLMLDRYGPKKIIPSCILLTVIGLLPFIFSTCWVYPVIGRLLIGIGSSASILGIFKIIRMAFTERRFPRMLSFSVTIGLIGAIYGGGPVSYLKELIGFHPLVICAALGGIILALISFLLFPDLHEPSKRSIWSDLKEVMGNRHVILISLCAGLMVGPLEGFADVWGPAFLQHVYKFTPVLAASLASMIFLGMCFGSPVLTFIGEKWGNYLLTVTASGVLMTVGFSWVLLSIVPNYSLLTSIFVIVGICSAYQILAIYKASTYVRAQVIGLATAVANMIIMIFGYAFHTIIGLVVDLLGGPQVPLAIEWGVAIIPIALGIGTIGFAALCWQQRDRGRSH